MADENRRRDGWLERIAAAQSYAKLTVQLVLWSAIVIFASKTSIDSGRPTLAGVFCFLIFGPLLLLTLATLYTKVRRGAALIGPSPEQLDMQAYMRRIQRPRRRIVWLTVVALLLIAVIELFIQALHHHATPIRQSAKPPGRSEFDKSLRIPT
jgi:hypothetical protein